MKKVMIGLLVALMAVSSFGGVVVMWEAYGIQSGANPSMGVLADASTKYVLWDLVYTTASSITTPTLDSSTGDISYGGGSDSVVSSRLITPVTPSGDVYGEAKVTDVLASSDTSELSPTPVEMGDYAWFIDGSQSTYKNLTTAYTSGNLYSAVFQYTTSGDVYYALTDLVTDQNMWNNPGTNPPTDVKFSINSDTALEKLGTVTPAPEPATMSLLGLGALAMVLRRKLRK